MGGSSSQETEGPEVAAASVTEELTSSSTDCGVQGSATMDALPRDKNQQQSSQKTWGDRASAEGSVTFSKSDSIEKDVLVPDGQSVKAGSSGTCTNTDTEGEFGSSIATGTVQQKDLGGVQGSAVLSISNTGKGKKLPEKGSCVENRGLAKVDLKSARQQGDSTQS